MQYRPPRSARKLTAEKTEKGEIINRVHKNRIFHNGFDLRSKYILKRKSSLF
jgi:hypothetical protein